MNFFKRFRLIKEFQLSNEQLIISLLAKLTGNQKIQEDVQELLTLEMQILESCFKHKKRRFKLWK